MTVFGRRLHTAEVEGATYKPWRRRMRRSRGVVVGVGGNASARVAGAATARATVTDPTLSCTSTSGTFSATLNGQAWSACGVVAVRRDSTFLGGKDTLRTVSWAGSGFLPGNVAYAVVIGASRLGPLIPGTYAVGLVTPTNSNFIVGDSNNGGWGRESNGRLRQRDDNGDHEQSNHGNVHLRRRADDGHGHRDAAGPEREVRFELLVVILRSAAVILRSAATKDLLSPSGYQNGTVDPSLRSG